MDFHRLARYRSLYKRSTRMGADRIFNRFLGLPEDQIVPLSISHGVDFGHMQEPMDIQGAEPIHWAYNESIYWRSIRSKPTIRAPHPWLMLASYQDPGPSTGTIVVAAPPSPENDEALLPILHETKGDFTVLVKARGNYKPSMTFWKNHGITAVTAGSEGPSFYHNLYTIISGADRVIGCTMSSALVFAAAIGKPISTFEDYTHHTYMLNFDNYNFQRGPVRDAVMALIDNSARKATRFAQELLGAPYLDSSETIRNNYLREIAEAKDPVFFRNKHNQIAKYLLAEAGRLTGRVGAVNNLRAGIRESLRGREVYAVRINEIAAWKTGDLARCANGEHVKYAKGITEAGNAVNPY